MTTIRATRQTTPPPAMPRHLAIAILVLVTVTILLAAFARQTGIGRTPDAPIVVQSRSIVLQPAPDGRMLVLDAKTGDTIEALPSANEGFVAGIWRAVKFDRDRQRIDLAAPLEIVLSMDAGLLLIDPQTGVRLQLEAYGRDNRNTFARFLPAYGSQATR
jgi:putative photosynthetic complex assembly protein